MTLHKEHRTPRTFQCLRQIVTPNKRFFVSLNTQSESKTKPNRWKTQSDFVKHQIVPEIYKDKNRFVCTCVKLRMFWNYQYQHTKAVLVNGKLLKILNNKIMSLKFKLQCPASYSSVHINCKPVIVNISWNSLINS